MEILRPRTAASLSGGDPFPEVAVAWRDFSDEADTIRHMINVASGDMALKEFTLGVIHDAGAASRAEVDQALAIGEWVQKNIFYVHEHGEILQRPQTTLRLRAGDCDDFTILICSMLGTVGIREKCCIIKTGKGTGADAVGPMRYSHIFAVALPVQDGKPHRLTLDATLDEVKYPIRGLTNPIALVKERGDRVEPLFV